MSSILNSVLSLSAMGLVFGAGLAYASQKFAVEVDPKEEAILNALQELTVVDVDFQDVVD